MAEYSNAFLINPQIVFGTWYLLRMNEHNLMNERAFQSYKHYKTNMMKTKSLRFTVFYLCFAWLIVSLYTYGIYFSLNHKNDVAVVWILLSLICVLFDFVVVDFILIIVQLWINGISNKYERKIFKLRYLKVAKKFPETK